MTFKYWLVFITGLIPLLVGFVYYHEKTFGKIWMSVSGMTEEKARSGNMLKTFGLTYLLGIMLSFFFSALAIHQSVLSQLFMGTDFETVGSADHTLYNSIIQRVGDLHRGWKHGIIHGVVTSLFFVMPILAINSMFEQRGWKYTAVHLGYWTITLALIGGVLCAYM